jgi:hypothetical protein
MAAAVGPGSCRSRRRATLQAAAPSRSYGAEAARITTALAAVRNRLGDSAYDRAWTAGAARTLAEAADDAMHLLDSSPGSD